MTPKRTARLNLRVPPETLARVRAIARRLKRSTSWVAVDIIERALEREERRVK